MGQLIVVNQGEVVIRFAKPTQGKITFTELGIDAKDLLLEGGFLRMVFDFEGIGEHDYFQVPTIHVAYTEKIADTRWICDFNEETILDKTDHFGNSTVILLDRKKIAELEHHHENKLVLHAEFPTSVQIIPEESYINFFK